APEATSAPKIIEIAEAPEAISAPKTIEITETPEATSAPKIIKIAEAPDNSIPQSQVKITKDIKTELNSENKIMAFSSLKQKLGNPSLSYPDFAREREMQGLISLLFFVDENGLVDKIQLEKSSGYSELDNFVLRVLSQYRFLENQSGWVRYEQNFILEGEEKQYLRLRQEEE
ncbi:MAG: TonB family protein, partial [Bdellovibrionaceae bacterium]|nr:TonB family protein [Pseudobdellovibrionaceae bacterium]